MIPSLICCSLRIWQLNLSLLGHSPFLSPPAPLPHLGINFLWKFSSKFPGRSHALPWSLLHLTDAPAVSQQTSYGVPGASSHQTMLCEAGRRGSGREPAVFPPFSDFYVWLVCPDRLWPSLATGRLVKWQSHASNLCVDAGKGEEDWEWKYWAGH